MMGRVDLLDVAAALFALGMVLSADDRPLLVVPRSGPVQSRVLGATSRTITQLPRPLGRS